MIIAARGTVRSFNSPPPFAEEGEGGGSSLKSPLRSNATSRFIGELPWLLDSGHIPKEMHGNTAKNQHEHGQNRKKGPNWSLGTEGINASKEEYESDQHTGTDEDKEFAEHGVAPRSI